MLRRIGRGLAVGKKVDVVRLVGAGLNGIELGAELFGCEHGGRQRAECAGAAGGKSEPATLHAGHRRLNHGQAAAEQLKQVCGVHGVFLVGV